MDHKMLKPRKRGGQPGNGNALKQARHTRQAKVLRKRLREEIHAIQNARLLAIARLLETRGA